MSVYVDTMKVNGVQTTLECTLKQHERYSVLQFFMGICMNGQNLVELSFVIVNFYIEIAGLMNL